ncbi:hypothetical protein VIOR103205_06630 [Vibrio ordalii]
MILRRLLTLTFFCLSLSTLASDFSLPIWKDKAEALGYTLPKPVFFKLVVIICLDIKQHLFLDLNALHQQAHSF